MPIAPYSPDRNPLNRFCEVATGITMSALTSSRPTVRIAVVTVIAASTTMSRLYVRTRSPSTRAKSSSANSAQACPRHNANASSNKATVCAGSLSRARWPCATNAVNLPASTPSSSVTARSSARRVTRKRRRATCAGSPVAATRSTAAST